MLSQQTLDHFNGIATAIDSQDTTSQWALECARQATQQKVPTTLVIELPVTGSPRVGVLAGDTGMHLEQPGTNR